MSSFVGRDDTLGSIAAAFDRSRLVTLVGEGGVGKSRLAVHVAADMLARFPGGAWICELASATDGDHAVEIVAASLGIVRQASTTLERSVLEALRDRQALLLLDNCDHVIDHACDFARLTLAFCPNVCVLATSREPLHADGEQVVRVEPLALPSGVADPPWAPSVELFVDRARSVRSDLEFDEEQMHAVAEICVRLDGLPLAIELAAAAVIAATPLEIAQHLDERFRILRTTRRGIAARHQTLRSVVDWSYSTLGAHEQLVYARLGTFHGSFDEAAAISVGADGQLDDWAVRDALAGLVAKSMVRASHALGRTRYEMLETLRAYALELLDDESTEAARVAHARHYAATVAPAALDLWTADEFAVQARVTADLDNLRTAVDWALAQPDRTHRRFALEIVDALAAETMLRPALGVGEWAERALLVPDDEIVGLEGVPFAVAFARMWRGEIAEGAAIAAGLLERLDDPADLRHAAALNIVAIERLMMGDVEFGRTQFRTALTALEARSRDAESWGIARWAYSMWSSMWANFTGDHADARQFADRTLDVARTANNPSMLAAALFVSAQSIAEDDPEGALRCLAEGAALTHSGAAAAVYGPALGLSGALLARQGDPIGALQHLHAGLAYLHRDLGVAMSADVFDGIARSCSEIGEAELSATILGARVEGSIAGHHGRLSGLDAEALADALRGAMDPPVSSPRTDGVRRCRSTS